MPTSPSISTNSPPLVYRFTVGGTSGEISAFTLVNSDGTEVFGAGSLASQVQGNIGSGVADGSTNPVKVGGIASAAIPTTATAFQRVNLWLGLNGQTVIGGTTFTGADGSSNTLTQMTISGGSAGHQTTAGYVFNGTTWDRQRGDTVGTDMVMSVRATAGGLTQFRRLATADTNLAVVKGSAGRVYAYTISNTTASAKFVRLYNKATAPVPASDNALILRTIMVPANGIASHQVMAGLGGFTNGIAIDATGAIADTDATALAANDLIISIDYA